MTNEEVSNIAIWAVDVADRYNTQITKVIEIFKAINKNQKNIEIVKSMVEEGFTQAIREGLANE